MKADNISETVVKEILRPNAADLSPKNHSPYTSKKQSGKKNESTFSAELSKRQMTPSEVRQLRAETHRQIEKMMDDSVTISGAQNIQKKNADNISDTERASLASTALDYSNRRRFDSYSQNAGNTPKKDEPSSVSVFNIIFIICGLFLIVTGFIYIPVGIIWMLVGVLMFLYAFTKK